MTHTTPPRGAAVLGAAVLVAAAVLFCIRPFIDSDPYWHMALGRAVLAHHARTVPEPYALSAFPALVTVPEWLWGVLTHGLYQLGGWGALQVLVCLLCAATALCLVRLGRLVAGPAAPLSPHVIVALVLLVIMTRMRLRPEITGKAMLALCLLLAYEQARSEGRRLLLLGAGQVLATLVWAQLHGSFILAPAVCAIVLLPAALRAADRRARTILLGTVFLCGACLLSSAFGTGIFVYLSAHGQGDAKLYVADMMPPNLDVFNPWVSVPGTAYLLLWLIGIAGMLRQGRVYSVEVALGLCGLVLGLRSLRFLTEGAILALPLACSGAAALATMVKGPRLGIGVAAACTLAALGAATRDVESFGRIGPAPGVYPGAAVSYLASLAAAPAAGGPIDVLSSYDAGAPLGLLLGGRVRTYVDSRTPLHFDDTDLALSRDIFTHPASLALALSRYRFRAVVIERSVPVCPALEADWVAVALDPRFTTFVPRAAAPDGALLALSPCGAEYLRRDACAEGGARLDRDLARLRGVAESAFVGYLSAERVVRCGGSIDAVPALLADEDAAAPFARQQARLRGRYYIATGQMAAALSHAEAALRARDPAVLSQLVGPMLQAGGDRRALRKRVQLAVEIGRDAAPVELRALLAQLCTEEGDEECARFHGTRAAVLGSARALPVLRWLRDRHSVPRVRADAAAWLAAIEAQRAAAREPPAPAPSGAPAPETQKE